MNTEITVNEAKQIYAFAERQSAGGSSTGERVKFVDGRYTQAGIPVPGDKEFLVAGIKQEGLYWPGNGQPPDKCPIDDNNPISKIDELNGNIPEDNWPVGPDGKTKTPPWRVYDVITLVDENTGAGSVLSNCTVGQRIATDYLHGQTQRMCAMRGIPVLPVIKLGSAPMRTPGGQKLRPAFEVVGWRTLTGHGNGQPMLEPVKAPTTEEIVGDKIPDLPWADEIPSTL